MKYIPALDGIRAVAVVFVLAAHFDPTGLFTGAGTVGVDLFFVLSGFLITSILWEQWSRDRRIKLHVFYWRRVLRLWPALALLLALYSASAPLISTVPRDHIRAAVAAGLSYMNWQQAVAHGPEGFVGHAWSLSIEEQFYLVWPTLMVVLLRRCSRRAVVGALTIFLLIGIAWRGYLTFTGVPVIRIYAGTDTHADALIIGCLTALIVLSTVVKEALARTWAIASIGLLVIALIPAWSTRWFLWEFTATGFLGAWLILAAIDLQQKLLVSVLSWSPLIWLGRRSYGIYLWHVPILKALNLAGMPLVTRAVIGIPLSLLVAAASYRFVEEPFLRLKARQGGPTKREGLTDSSELMVNGVRMHIPVTARN